MVVLIKIIQVIFALSILVLAHELDIFYLQNFFKTRVNKFYLFLTLNFPFCAPRKSTVNGDSNFLEKSPDL